MSTPNQKYIRGRIWKHDGLVDRFFVTEATEAGDDVTGIWVGVPDDGPTVLLNANQLDEIADDLKARAALMRGES